MCIKLTQIVWEHIIRSKKNSQMTTPSVNQLIDELGISDFITKKDSTHIGLRDNDGWTQVSFFCKRDKMYKPVKPRRRNPTDENVMRIFEELLKLKELVGIDFPSEFEKRIMIHGFPQSGKSFVQFALMWYSAFVLKKNTIHLLMERMDSLLQNISRDYPGFCKEIQKICQSLDIPDYKNYIFNYLPFPKYAVTALKNTEIDSQSNLTVHVAIANVTQLNHIVKLPLDKRQTVISDEADIFIKEEGKPVTIRIDQIMDEAEYRFECTATPFSNFNVPEQFYDRIIKLVPKPIYRGYDSPLIKRHIVSKVRIVPILRREFARDTGDYKNIILVNVSSKNNKQTIIKNLIETNFPNVIVKIINSDPKNKYVRPLSHTMNELANEPSDRPIVIISGFMASRAVSFRTSKENQKQAILTGMIYLPSEDANQSTLMQAMRIFGNYDAGYPIINAYWTEEVDHAIQSSFKNNNAVIDSIVPEKSSRECIEEVPLAYIGRKMGSNDDLHYESLNSMEFDSVQEIHDYITNNKNIPVSTYQNTVEKIVSVKIPSFEYNASMSEKGEIRKRVRLELEKNLPELKDYNFKTGNLHVAWSEDRYQTLFSIKNRQNPKHTEYNTCFFTCGNPVPGPQTMMNCVVWKSGFETASNWNIPGCAYVYRTTTKKWKVYLHGRNEFKKVTHE